MSAYGMAGRRTVERSCRFMSTTDPKKSQMPTQEVARRRGLTESTIRNWTLATEAATAPVVPLPKTPGRHARQWPADEVLALEAALPDRELIRATGMCLHCLLRLADREVLPASRQPPRARLPEPTCGRCSAALRPTTRGENGKARFPHRRA